MLAFLHQFIQTKNMIYVYHYMNSDFYYFLNRQKLLYHKRFLFVFLPIQLLLFHRYNIWYLMCICVTPYHTKLYQTPVAVLYDMFMSWLMFWKDQYRETEENQWKKLLGWAISCRCVNQSPSCFREGSTKNEGYKWHEKKYNVLIQFMHVW